jgi:hypothetical protein
MKYNKVAMRADLAQENASQVPHRAIVHAWSDDGGRMAGTLCNATIDVRLVQIVERNRVVSCPTCIDELRKLAAVKLRKEFDQADTELVTIMRQRAQIATDCGNRDLAKALFIAADVLRIHATGEQIPHDTSVPQAGDDALSRTKELNAALRPGSECKYTFDATAEEIDGIPHFTPYDKKQ